MSNQNNGTAKHIVVREALTESIRRGDYKPGERLPAEREIAQIYGVSYMTARRAVTEMVEVDLLQRRAREGTFVPLETGPRLATTTVHLVCPAFESSAIRAFLRLGAQAAEARGWRTEVIRLHDQQARAAIRALDSGDLLIILPAGPELDGPLAQAIQKAAGRAVVLGNRLDHLGVPSVLADDAQGIRLAMEHLHAQGHREIAVVSDHPAHPIDRVQIAAWEAALPADWDETHIARRTILVNTPRHQSQAEHTYAAIKNYLAHDENQTTALLCLIDEMSLPALAACRDAQRPVPEKMSLIASGDSPTMAYTHPPVTCIDIHMAQHVARAMEVLDNFLENRLDPARCLHLVEPHLALRESVSAPPVN